MVVPISIIIPIRNETPAVLEELLVSLKRQTLLPQEVIFAEADPMDGIDKTGTFIKNWWACNAWKDGNCQVLPNPGVFPGAGRNVGISNAKGKWIAFLDVGIVPEPEWLKALFDCVNVHQGEGVFGVCRFSGEGVIGRAACALSYGHGVIQENTLPGALFDRKVFAVDKENVRLFRPDLRAAEDTIWKDNTHVKHVCREAVVHYTKFPNSVQEVLIKWFSYSSSQAKAGVSKGQQIAYSACLCLFVAGALVNASVTMFVLGIYVVARGVLDPIRRSRSWHWWEGEPLALVAAVPLSLIMDIAKATGFLFGYAERVIGNRLTKADRASV